MAIYHLTFHFSLGAQRRKNRCLSSSPPESRKNCLRFIRINVTLCLQTNRNCLGFSLWLACNAFNLIWLRRNILLSIFGKKANELQFSVLTNRNENLQNEAKTFTQHKCERKQKYFWSNLICEMWTRRACESVKWMCVCVDCINNELHLIYMQIYRTLTIKCHQSHWIRINYIFIKWILIFFHGFFTYFWCYVAIDEEKRIIFLYYISVFFFILVMRRPRVMIK